MKFRFYFKTLNYGKENKYYKNITADNKDKAFIKFFNYINEKANYNVIEIIKVEKFIEENGIIKIFEEKQERSEKDDKSRR